MGLDMYLYARHSKYQSSHKWEGEPERLYPSELKGFEEDILERNFSSVEVKEDFQIGYWRKANAIHGWIVKNCANGEDNCQVIALSIKDMEKLLSLCVEVLKEHSKASELLPCEDGFFFGPQKYDEWYFADVEYTKGILEKALAFIKAHKSEDYHERWSIVYQASW